MSGFIYADNISSQDNSQPNESHTVPKQYAAVVNLLYGNRPTYTAESIELRQCKNNNYALNKWYTKYPQLRTINTNCQTAVIDKLRTSKSISALIGPINNPYGVRDDILDYIVQNVPSDNPKLLQAAIAMAYFDNLALYSKSNEDKLKYVRRFSLAMHCMYMFSDKSPHELVDILANQMRNTKELQRYLSKIQQTVFAWQTLGSGYGSNTEDEMCNTGGVFKMRNKLSLISLLMSLAIGYAEEDQSNTLPPPMTIII